MYLMLTQPAAHIRARIDVSAPTLLSHQLVLWSVLLQLVAGVTKKLQIGNVAASAFRTGDYMINDQVTRLEVVAGTGYYGSPASVCPAHVPS